MSQRTFLVRLRGFDRDETHNIARIFRLSAMRPRRYEVCNDPGAEIDLLILNGDKPDSHRATEYPGRKPPCLLITHQQDPAVLPSGRWPDCPLCPNHECYALKRPMLAVRVLRVLDTMTIEQLGYTPELIVGNQEKINELVAPDSYRRALATAARRANSNGLDDPTPRAMLKALVVDDSLAVRTQMSLQLESLGMKADFAERGDKALLLAKIRRYDLVFLDVVMPGQDGFQVCRGLRQLENPPRIVMLTSKTSTLSRARGALAGADAYLTKPMESSALCKVLRDLFGDIACASPGASPEASSGASPDTGTAAFAH